MTYQIDLAGTILPEQDRVAKGGGSDEVDKAYVMCMHLLAFVVIVFSLYFVVYSP